MTIYQPTILSTTTWKLDFGTTGQRNIGIRFQDRTDMSWFATSFTDIRMTFDGDGFDEISIDYVKVFSCDDIELTYTV